MRPLSLDSDLRFVCIISAVLACLAGSLASMRSSVSEMPLFGYPIPEAGPIPIIDLLDHLDDCKPSDS